MKGHSRCDVIESYTILTTSPNAVMEPIHNRMPVILGPDAEDEWLDPNISVDTARTMCQPCPSDWLELSPVT